MEENKACPYCAEPIRVEVIKCKHCGEFLVVEQETLDTTEQSVRRGTSRALSNYQAQRWFYIELGLIAIICGIVWKSWWLFLGIMVGFSFLLQIKYLGKLICILLSLGWVLVGMALGIAFRSDTASIVLAILFFLSGLGFHFSGL